MFAGYQGNSAVVSIPRLQPRWRHVTATSSAERDVTMAPTISIFPSSGPRKMETKSGKRSSEPMSQRRANRRSEMRWKTSQKDSRTCSISIEGGNLCNEPTNKKIAAFHLICALCTNPECKQQKLLAAIPFTQLRSLKTASCVVLSGGKVETIGCGDDIRCPRPDRFWISSTEPKTQKTRYDLTCCPSASACRLETGQVSAFLLALVVVPTVSWHLYILCIQIP